MRSNAYADRDRILAALSAIKEATATLADCSLDALTSEEILDVLGERETLARAAPAFDHRLIARLVVDGNPGVLGAANLKLVLTERLRISRRAAGRRLADAADLGPRTTLDGQPLAPRMPQVAAAVAAGAIGPQHVAIAREVYAQIPGSVAPDLREAAEADLAGLATQFGPEMYRRVAGHLLTVLDPDGDFQERRRRAGRGLSLGPQGSDGMSALTGRLTPEARATLEPILAKLAAPGMCNPADAHPCVSGTPTEDQIRADDRTARQRSHDALVAMSRAVLAAGDLGQLNGLPVTVIVTATLAELEAAAAAHPDAAPDWGAPAGAAGAADSGRGCDGADRVPGPDAGNGWVITAGGTRLPMRDLLRLAGHAHHYLVLFDGAGRALWLGRSKRVASADQRIVLVARDRGCTRPGCAVPAYGCQAHHLDNWTPGAGAGPGGRTDVDELALACRADNNMADKFDWTTIRNSRGRIEWCPPAALERGQPRVNTVNFPEELLARYRGLRQPDHGAGWPEDPRGWFDRAIDDHRDYDRFTNAELDELAAIHDAWDEPGSYEAPDLTDDEFRALIDRDPQRHWRAEDAP